MLIKNFFYIVIGFLGICFIIGFHELGHFLFCKLFKIKTPSFSIGMGPRLLSKKIGDTLFSLSAIPLGGYVEIAGLAEVGQGDQLEASSTDAESFESRPFYQKFLVLFGGIFFNTLLAYIIFVLLYTTGMPQSPLLFPESCAPIIGEIQPGSAAERHNLQLNDVIVAINGDSVEKNTNQVLQKLKNVSNQQIAITVERNGQKIIIPVTMGEKLGIGFKESHQPPLPLHQSIVNAAWATKTAIVKTFQVFKSIVSERSMRNIGGPIGVISATMVGAQKGIAIFLFFIAFISINLAVLNCIPVPILDGGQILFTTIEALIRRPLPLNIRLYIHYASWILMMLLFAYLSIWDIKRIFWG